MATKKPNGPPEAFEALYKYTKELLSIDYGEKGAMAKESDILEKLTYHTNRIEKWRKNQSKTGRVKSRRKNSK